MSPLKGIDDCFERGLLRKVEPSLAKGNQFLIQAGDWLSEAEKNLQAEAYRSALSSAYSAIFHSAIVWALVRFASTFSLPFLSDLQLLIDAELNRS